MTAPYVLYYSPGACSISPHIALLESDQPFTLDRVDLRAKKTSTGEDYFAINPSGYVPTLRLPDGSILTEGAVMVQYIADQRPESQLAPPNGTMARYRMQEWLNFIATELHKGMSPFYNALAGEDFKAQLAQRFAKRWDHVAKQLGERSFLFGDQFTIVDGYMFYVLRAWQRSAKQDLTAWPRLVAYYQALAIRPTIAAALAAEGIAA